MQEKTAWRASGSGVSAVSPLRVEKVVVVQLVVVRRHLPLDLGGVHPGHEVLEVARHQVGWVAHRLGSHPHVPLLDERHGFPQRLRHLQPHHDHAQAPAAEARGAELVAQRQALLAGDRAHVVELLQQRVGQRQPVRVARVQRLEHADELGDHAAELVVLLVIVAVLQVVPPHHLHLAVVVLGFPLQEVHLLQQLLLVVLELAHGGCWS
mmetsp:Transcript_10571/g.25884  ORF Transcript_10571/g.25884 Transcript_10571/m.25884 type:complete len:209 (+) Transcript_10571:149-775(+)